MTTRKTKITRSMLETANMAQAKEIAAIKDRHASEIAHWREAMTLMGEKNRKLYADNEALREALRKEMKRPEPNVLHVAENVRDDWASSREYDEQREGERIAKMQKELEFKKVQNTLMNEQYNKLAERVAKLEACYKYLSNMLEELASANKTSPESEPEDARQEKFILISGNPVDGCEYYGPYTVYADAEAQGDRLGGDWWIKELTL